jgi:hypothetical protein
MAERFGCNSEGAAPEPFTKSIYKVYNNLVSVHPVEQPEAAVEPIARDQCSKRDVSSPLDSNQSCTVLQCMDVGKTVSTGSCLVRKGADR